MKWHGYYSGGAGNTFYAHDLYFSAPDIDHAARELLFHISQAASQLAPVTYFRLVEVLDINATPQSTASTTA